MEILRALAVLAEPPIPEHGPIRDSLELGEAPRPEDYTDCFLFHYPPFASVYLGPEGMMGGVARDRIAGFWRAGGWTPPPAPDELVVLLAFCASFAERARGERDRHRRSVLRRARSVFLREHVLSWLPFLLVRIGRDAPSFYRRWAALLLDALRQEAHELGGEDDPLPIHLREAPPVPSARELDREGLVHHLLATVRSGLVLTRSDLERAARELGICGRQTDRRSTLNGLLAVDAAGTSAWLAAEARTSATLPPSMPDGAPSAWWSLRARATAELLTAWAADHEPRPESRA